MRRVPVSTLLFWQQIFEEKKPRSLWQRLRHLLSLLLQLAFLCLLVFALADPIFRWQQARARRMVLVVDNSASMNATDVSPTRLDAAKAEGRKLIDGMRLGDELAIIAAGAQPRVACGPTDHERTLREALDSIAPVDGPTRVGEAVALARRLLSGSEKIRKVVVLTDGGFEGAGDLARQDDVELISVGKKTGNVGITRLAGAAQPARPDRLRDPGRGLSTPRTSLSRCRLELDLDDDPIDVVPLNSGSGRDERPGLREDLGRWRPAPRHDRPRRMPAGGQHRLGDPPPPRPPEGDAWSRRGTCSSKRCSRRFPLVDLDVIKVARTANRSRRPAAPGGGADHASFIARFPTSCRAGNVLVIEPESSGPLWELGEAIHNPVVAKQDKDSPLDAAHPARQCADARGPQADAEGTGAGAGRVGRGDPLYAVLDRPDGGTGQGRRAHRRPGQERPAAPDRVSDHDDATCSTGSAAPRASCARHSPPAAVAEVELAGRRSDECRSMS